MTSPELLETILKKTGREKTVERVLSVTETSVVGKGDNYASDMTRADMKVVLGSGKIANKSVIIKSVPAQELRAKHLQNWGLFKREIKMYEEVLPCLESIMQEIHEHSEPIWAECLMNRPFDMLIFEDLKSQGYKMANRLKGMDLDHATMAFQSLAKFHAASVVLRDRGMLDPDEFKYVMIKDETDAIMQSFHDTVFTTMSSVIEKYWGPGWEDYVDFLKSMQGKSIKILSDAMKRDDTKLNVLNHGDFWVNNMMFKYSSLTNKPIALKIIDFQICYYNLYAFDLHYCLNSSIDLDVRNNHIDKILKVYQATLQQELEAYGIEAGRIPNLDTIKEDFDRTSYFGLITACCLLCIMKSDPDDAMDIEDALKKMEQSGTIELNVRPYLGKSYTEHLQCIFEHYRKDGSLDKWKKLASE